jgi:hypothetical protein
MDAVGNYKQNTLITLFKKLTVLAFLRNLELLCPFFKDFDALIVVVSVRHVFFYNNLFCYWLNNFLA